MNADVDTIQPKRFWSKIIRPRVLIIVLFVAGVGYVAYDYLKPNGPQYNFIEVGRGSIIEEISESGRVTSPEAIDLYFEISGRVKNVLISEGDAMVAGQAIMKLDTTNLEIRQREAAAALASVQAKYSQALAGASPEELRVYETAATNAERNLAETRNSTYSSVAAASSGVEAAETTYNNAVTTLNNTRVSAATILNNLYEITKTTMRSNSVAMSTALTDVDNILGIDNNIANDSFEIYLGVMNPQTKIVAENAYREAKIAIESATDIVGNLNRGTPQSVIDSTVIVVKDALTKTLAALERTSLVLNVSTVSAIFTLTELNTKKTTINTDRTTITAALSNLETAEQNIATARNTNQTNIHTAQTARDAAERSLATARATLNSAEVSGNTSITAAEGVLQSARDELAARRAPLRDVDRAVYLSAISSAQASLDFIRQQITQATLTAPINGAIGHLDLRVGELATTLTRAASMISSQLQIDVDVSELDIRKISVDSLVEATFDALGLQVYSGKVIMIASEEKVVDEDIFYKVTVVLDASDVLLRSGMTADVSIKVAAKDDALVAPLRLLIKRSGKRYMRVLRGNTVEEVEIQTGLESEDVIEIVSGLNEGDRVVTE